ncbi:Uncharacterised protein [Vibrio cholerae]|nr:Uncharacterised protein [Vibrio cholerae]CSI47984.1 Uncharacterised protein [Vibrio cholerae]
MFSISDAATVHHHAANSQSESVLAWRAAEVAINR